MYFRGCLTPRGFSGWITCITRALRYKFSRALVRAFARLAIEERQVELLEMEETFGLVQLVKVASSHSNSSAPAWSPLRQCELPKGLPPIRCFMHGSGMREWGLRRRMPYRRRHWTFWSEPVSIMDCLFAEAVVIGCPAPIVPIEHAVVAGGVATCERDRILFVGRFDRHKGGDVAIDSMRTISSRFPNARLWFAGRDTGLMDDHGRRRNIGNYLAERAPEVAGHVEWLGESVRCRRATGTEAWRRAFVTVVASRYENFPMAVLEALAHGCPLVATRAGGIVEIGEDGVNCQLVPAGDSEELANAVCRLMADPELAARLGARAGDDAIRRYHPETIARQTAAFHRSVVAQRNERKGR